MGLREYAKKRDFARTQEPRGSVRRSGKKLAFVVQLHDATRMHHDFRLEHGGVLLSWAVPKGPSFDPAERRLAVEVEDHPLDYGSFEGTIPEGQYGGGTVMLWDRGEWRPDGDVDEALKKGKLEFELYGHKLKGGWRLVRLRAREPGEKPQWLLMKRHDEHAKSGAPDEAAASARSVKSRRSLAEIAKADGKVWRNGRAEAREPVARARKASTTVARRAQGSKRAAPRAARKTRASGSRSKPRKAPGSPRSAKVDVRQLPGARAERLPSFVAPELATLRDKAPSGDGWVHEVKYDGYRMQARLADGRVTWVSRNHLDWSARFAPLSPAIAALSAREALLDGEIVALDEHGVSHFQLLQNALAEKRTDELLYVVFDVLHLDGYGLRGCTLADRRAALEKLLRGIGRRGTLRISEPVSGDGARVLQVACDARLEGIVSKRADARYVSGRTLDWTKSKCTRRQEFVITGFTEPQGSRSGFGSLVLGVHEKGKLRHAGRVGTGFGHALLRTLRKRLDALRVDAPPFDEPLSSGARRGVTWVRPELVGEVAFTGWTADGALRHPAFEGLREDKPAREVVREREQRVPTAANARARASTPAAARVARSPEKTKSGKRAARGKSSAHAEDASTIAGVALSHPERVLDAQSGVTKLDVARFYAEIAELILPEVAGRPLSVVRTPTGFAGERFFQKHWTASMPRAVGSVPIRDSNGRSRYLCIDSLEGLLGLVQMNAYEIHPWGSRADDPDKPDRMFFDLDPAPDVPFERVVDAARWLKDALTRLDLAPFVKTSGGKGLHVVVPLVRKHTWDAVKDFSHALASGMASTQPELFVDVATKARRGGRIFVDYLRNARGATAVAAYSIRAREGAPIAAPIAWSALATLNSADALRLAETPAAKLVKRADPWRDMQRSAAVLPSLRAVAGAKRASARPGRRR